MSIIYIESYVDIALIRRQTAGEDRLCVKKLVKCPAAPPSSLIPLLTPVPSSLSPLLSLCVVS